jgi:hypothetical protein
MKTLGLALIPGCETLRRLVIADSGEPAYFQPVQISKDGWSVAVVTGNKREGRQVMRVEGFEEIENLTLDQAVAAVENLTRDTIRALMAVQNI